MGKAKAFEPKVKVVDDCRYLELGELWKKGGKPPRFEPRVWTSLDNPDQEFAELIGCNDMDRDDVLIDEGKAGLWAYDSVALDFACFMVAVHSTKPKRAFLDWIGDACQASEDETVANRMRINGETEVEARTFLRRYC